MSEQFLDIVLRIRNELAQGLGQAKAQIAGFFNSLKNVFSGDALLGGGAALKFTAIVQSIKGVATAIRAGIQAAHGDTKGLLDTMERLPFGLGGLVAEWRSLFNIFNEYEQAAVEASKARWADWQAEQKRIAVEFKQGVQDAQDALVDKRASVALLERTGLQRELLKIQQEYNRETERLNSIARKMGGDSPELKEARDLAYKERELKFAEAKKKVADDEKAKAKELTRTKLEEEERIASETSKLRSEMRQSELEAAGKMIEAQIEQIQQKFRERRETATAEQRAILDQIEKSEIAAARRRAEDKTQDKSDSSATVVSRTFQGVAARREAESKRIVNAVEKVEKEASTIRQTIENAMKEWSSKMPRGVLV